MGSLFRLAELSGDCIDQACFGQTAGMALKNVPAVAGPLLGQHVKLQTTRDGAERFASIDPLTGLPDRHEFMAILRELASERAHTGIGFLMIDVRGLGRTNDVWGFSAGDALICLVADRLRTALRGTDHIIARLAGKEFGVFLGGMRSEDQLRASAVQIFNQTGGPFLHRGSWLQCDVNVGGSLLVKGDANGSDLVRNGHIALSSAKTAGRGIIQIFEPSLRAHLQNHETMLALARRALDEWRIRPYYQPKIDLQSGRLSGFEALLRWSHPSRGVQTPNTIHAAFDDCSLAVRISDRMISLVLVDARRWLDTGVDFGHIAINAAPADFRRGNFAQQLLKAADSAGVPCEFLTVEVTETVLVGRGAECVEEALATLSAAGVKIALDDFGTGYASLSHLRKFPVNVIKIDQSFIQRINADPTDDAIVRAVIGLGQSLNMKVVAEGIENGRQSARLREYGCDFGQGFLFGKAISSTSVPPFVAGQE